MNWKELFPLPVPRPAQEQAIEFALKELYENGKDCVVLELGLGIGKSAIAATLANYVALNPFATDEHR
jgi:Rad3-related DNA helicase